MQSPLTASGLLWESNFEEWKERIQAVLTVLGRPQRTSSTSAGRQWILKGVCTTDIWHVNNHIRPEILRRVPSLREAKTFDGYLKALEGVCQPFRLMELPPELRVIIFHVATLKHNFILSYEEGRVRPCRGIPAFAQATRQLRQEALPVFFEKTHFAYTIPGPGTTHISKRDPYAAMMRRIDRWTREVVGPSARHLRKFTISVVPKTPATGSSTLFSRVWIEIGFSKQDGLQFRFSEKLTAECQVRLRAFADDLEQQRKAGGMEGEIILKAITHPLRPWHWTSLDAKAERRIC